MTLLHPTSQDNDDRLFLFFYFESHRTWAVQLCMELERKWCYKTICYIVSIIWAYRHYMIYSPWVSFSDFRDVSLLRGEKSKDWRESKGKKKFEKFSIVSLACVVTFHVAWAWKFFFKFSLSFSCSFRLFLSPEHFSCSTAREHFHLHTYFDRILSNFRVVCVFVAAAQLREEWISSK